MDPIHPAIPLSALLFGAGALTLARYLVAPFTWRISNHLGRYALLEFAGLLAIGYFLILPAGPTAQMIAVSVPMRNATGIALLGLGAGFLVIALMLMFRRSE